MSLIVSVTVALRLRSKRVFLEPTAHSLPLDCWLDSWPGGGGGGVISLTTFLSLRPFSTYLKLSAAAAQSLQTPTGGSQVCILATQLSARRTGVAVNGNFSHNPPQTRSCLCGVADTLRAKLLFSATAI